MKGERFSGCKLALLHGEKVLIYRRDKKKGIPFPGMLDLPGGGREVDETAEQCVLRELQEEFGIDLPSNRLFYRRKYDLATPGQFGYFFVGDIFESEIKNISFGDEGMDWQFMDVEEYLKHPEAIPHLQKRLFEYFDFIKGK